MGRALCRHVRAFSLVELVIVVVIIGVVGAIAVPRLGRAAANAELTAVKADTSTLQKAIDHYSTEHGGLSPAQNADGTPNSDPRTFVRKLLGPTTPKITFGAGASLGPYLREWPANQLNDSKLLRFDGVPAGANLAGWRFDTAAKRIEPDTLVAVTKPPGTDPDVGISPTDDLVPVGGGGGAFGAQAVGGGRGGE